MKRSLAYARLNNNLRLYPQDFGSAGFDLLRHGLLRGLGAAGFDLQIVTPAFRDRSPYQYVPYGVPQTHFLILENSSLNPLFEYKGEPNMLRVFRLLSQYRGVIFYFFDDVALLFDRQVEKYLSGWKRRGLDVSGIDLEIGKRWIYLHRGENCGKVMALFQKRIILGGELMFFPNGLDGSIATQHFPVWSRKENDLVYIGYARSPNRIRRMRKYYAGSGGIIVGKGWKEVEGFGGCRIAEPIPQRDVPMLLHACKVTPLVGDSFYAESGWHCFRYYEAIMSGCLVFVADDYYEAIKFARDTRCIFSSGEELKEKVASLTPTLYQELYQKQLSAALGNEWSNLGQRLMEICDGLVTAPRPA